MVGITQSSSGISWSSPERQACSWQSTTTSTAAMPQIVLLRVFLPRFPSFIPVLMLAPRSVLITDSNMWPSTRLSHAYRNRSRVGPKKSFKFNLTGIPIRFRIFRVTCIVHIGTHWVIAMHIGLFFSPRGSKISFALLNASCVHNCFRKKVGAVAVDGYKSTKCHLAGRLPTSL